MKKQERVQKLKSDLEELNYLLEENQSEQQELRSVERSLKKDKEVIENELGALGVEVGL